MMKKEAEESVQLNQPFCLVTNGLTRMKMKMMKMIECQGELVGSREYAASSQRWPESNKSIKIIDTLIEPWQD